MVSVLKPEKVYAKKLVRGMGEVQVETPEMQQAALVK
jgi:S-adenosylmethionine decarboxylase